MFLLKEESREPGVAKKSRSAFSTSTIAFCSTGTFIYNNNSPTKVSITYLTVGPPLAYQNWNWSKEVR